MRRTAAVLFAAGGKKGSRLGWESSPLGDVRLDCTLLEKSVRQGCRSILARGSGTDSRTTSIFELLVDLAMTEDIKLDECLVGYCFGSGGDGREANARELMGSMGKNSRVLDYVNVPVELGSNGAPTPAVLHERASLQAALGGPSVVKVGLDLTTSALHQLSDAQVEVLLASLRETRTPALTVATNALTARQSRRIIEWAAASSGASNRAPLLVVSTEVLRVDPKRPALLAPIPNLVLSAAGKIQESIAEATNDLKHGVDRCLMLEKHFMSKIHPDLAPPGVVLTDLCWAHVLMQAQHTVQSPEEWHYLLNNQVMPKLDACIENLKTKNKETGDWATLYAGMARNMFTTFATVQARRRELCLGEVVTALAKTGNVTTTVDALPLHLGALAASFGSSSTVLAGVEVRQLPADKATAAAEAEHTLTSIVAPLARELF